MPHCSLQGAAEGREGAWPLLSAFVQDSQGAKGGTPDQGEEGTQTAYFNKERGKRRDSYWVKLDLRLKTWKEFAERDTCCD